MISIQVQLQACRYSLYIENDLCLVTWTKRLYNVIIYTRPIRTQITSFPDHHHLVFSLNNLMTSIIKNFRIRCNVIGICSKGFWHIVKCTDAVPQLGYFNYFVTAEVAVLSIHYSDLSFDNSDTFHACIDYLINKNSIFSNRRQHHTRLTFDILQMQHADKMRMCKPIITYIFLNKTLVSASLSHVNVRCILAELCFEI